MLLQQKAEIARCQSEDCVLPADFDIHLSVFGKINEKFTTASYFAVTLRAIYKRFAASYPASIHWNFLQVDYQKTLTLGMAT